jgi:hypothetical protein
MPERANWSQGANFQANSNTVGCTAKSIARSLKQVGAEAWCPTRFAAST